MPRYFGFFKEFLNVNYFHNKVTPIIKIYKNLKKFSFISFYTPSLNTTIIYGSFRCCSIDDNSFKNELSIQI